MTNEELITHIDLRVAKNTANRDNVKFMAGERKWYRLYVREKLEGQNEALNWVKELLNDSVNTMKTEDSK